MWRWALLPLLGVLLVLHYAAFVGWGDLLHPTAACVDDDDGGWASNHLSRSSTGGGGGSDPPSGWLHGNALPGSSATSSPRTLLRSAAEAVLAWMLGVGAVQVPALVTLFLAFGACVTQVGGG